ncbi:hypothetical protein BC938DRAFT_482207 [Jimgerdemannia flammicorona]|uniref:Chloride channel n=2 Tax=Jimgerdemannia flammicorona TaxID=994334 RepID=A0A433QWM5_9FUNG|nr:hypothetical protein BC938DRAFT_482207 [Jimgerdemannia flammicorona]
MVFSHWRVYALFLDLDNPTANSKSCYARKFITSFPYIVSSSTYVLFSLTAAILVKISADVIATRCASPTAQPDLKVVYFAAGSGIAEVKTILGGFVIRKFLGIQTLIVKIIGSTLAVSSGLNCGKEGPFVHIACCVGNILCRIFSKFNKNEGKRREILSASAAAGVAVAFAAPIGGVLFSLEEVSYYFPIKTMIRSFFSALIAAMTLKLLNPFGNGKIAMFQVSYDRDWHWFEMAGFLLCGLFGGFFGAIFSKLNIRWQHVRKTTWLGRHPVAEVVVIMVITVLVSYWNPFARLDKLPPLKYGEIVGIAKLSLKLHNLDADLQFKNCMNTNDRMGLTEFVMNLFAECTSTNDNEGLCATTISAIYPRLNLLAATLVIKVILIIFTFGLRIPAGIFLPSLAVGAIFGRMVGLGMQYLTMRFPDLELFARCGSEMAAEGECVIPGVYAMVGAAASLAGVTRTTVSLVVIMFELTGALTYLLVR